MVILHNQFEIFERMLLNFEGSIQETIGNVNATSFHKGCGSYKESNSGKPFLGHENGGQNFGMK